MCSFQYLWCLSDNTAITGDTAVTGDWSITDTGAPLTAMAIEVGIISMPHPLKLVTNYALVGAGHEIYDHYSSQCRTKCPVKSEFACKWFVNGQDSLAQAEVLTEF